MAKIFKNKIIGIAYTFDDVLLVPAKSNVLPREVDILNETDQKHQVKHSTCQRSNGHGDRVRDGNSDCKGRWDWHNSQKYVY